MRNLYDLYYSVSVNLVDPITENRMGGACDTYRAEENTDIVLLRKPAGKSPLGRPEHRWDNNIIYIN